MLFELLASVTIVILGVGWVFCYRLGFKEGQAGKVIAAPVKKRTRAKIEPDRYDVILENINAYDGSAKGQKEVKG